MNSTNSSTQGTHERSERLKAALAELDGTAVTKIGYRCGEEYAQAIQVVLSEVERLERENAELRGALATRGSETSEVASGRSPQEWRDIETAPKDDRWLLLYSWRGVVYGRRSDDDQYDCEFFDDGFIGTTRTLNAASDFTHWQPLPEPPGSEPTTAPLADGGGR